MIRGGERENKEAVRTDCAENICSVQLQIEANSKSYTIQRRSSIKATTYKSIEYV